MTTRTTGSSSLNPLILLEHFSEPALSTGAVHYFHRDNRVHTGHSRKMTAVLQTVGSGTTKTSRAGTQVGSKTSRSRLRRCSVTHSCTAC